MKKILSARLEISILILICCLTFFLRAYATYRDLIFAYDQGRDAWQMQKIAHGNLTLIGPVTGLDGVYLGPFWYYLIFPAYFLGQGNPVFAAIEMKLFAVGVVILLYLWGRKMKLGWVGLVTGCIYAFSFSNILFARWLSNPVPLPFFALLSFYLLWEALERQKYWLFALTGIFLGCCLQLEAANGIWFIPTTIVIVLHESTNLKRKWQTVLMSFIALGAGGLLTIIPQFLFELKYKFLITKNLITAFHTTHDTSLKDSFFPRISLLLNLYGKGLFVDHVWLFIYFAIIFIFVVILFRSYLFTVRGWRIAFVWFFIPFFFHSIYTGNHGNFWDYYVIAQHVPLYLLLFLTAGLVARQKEWKPIVLCLSAIFFMISIGLNMRKWTEIIEPYPDRFSLQEQVDATNWMIEESHGESYGAWVYTPSAQDDPYRYVFDWVGKKQGVYPGEHVEQQPLIYLITEDDQVFWKRHNDWISERLKFGTLLARHKFGSITVYKLRNTFLKPKIVQ